VAALRNLAAALSRRARWPLRPRDRCSRLDETLGHRERYMREVSRPADAAGLELRECRFQPPGGLLQAQRPARPPLVDRLPLKISTSGAVAAH
jgi:hypothetical protein